MEIKPIKTAADHRRALAQIERLWGAPDGSPEADRLDVLATLVEAWESEHEPMPPPDPVAAIEFRMEQQGLSRKDLEPALGSRARVSEVLNRKRALTLEMIRRLHEQLGIPLESLVGRPSPARRNRKSPRSRTSRSSG